MIFDYINIVKYCQNDKLGKPMNNERHNWLLIYKIYKEILS